MCLFTAVALVHFTPLFFFFFFLLLLFRWAVVQQRGNATRGQRRVCYFLGKLVKLMSRPPPGELSPFPIRWLHVPVVWQSKYSHSTFLIGEELNPRSDAEVSEAPACDFSLLHRARGAVSSPNKASVSPSPCPCFPCDLTPAGVSVGGSWSVGFS